jgi:hypothetical protein
VVVTIRGHVIITTQEIRPTTTSNFPTVTVVLDTQVCMAILVIFNLYKITPFHKKINLKNKNGHMYGIDFEPYFTHCRLRYFYF